MSDAAALPPPVPLARLLAGRRVDAAAGRVQVPLAADWQQGRTTYGGLTAVLAVQAMRDLAGADWPLRALQTSFVGPVHGAAEIEVRVLRQGRHVRQVQAEVRSGGATAAMLGGVFGGGRATAVPPLRPSAPAVARGPQESTPPPFDAGRSPGFLRHLEVRWAEGDPPFTGGDSWHSRIHLRLRDAQAARELDGELLSVLLADMPPCPAIGRLSEPAPASSVSWELELLPQADPPAADGWWRADTDALAAADGYVNQRTTLWAPDGRVAAFGYQVAAVFG